MKYKVQRTLASVLAGIMLTTSVPFQSFADVNAGGSGSAGIAGAYGSDFGADRPRSRIGIRLSLVNSKTGEVMSVDGNKRPMVLDYVFTTKEQFKELTGLDITKDQIVQDLSIEDKDVYKTRVYPNHLFTSIRTQSLKSLEDFNAGDEKANNIQIITADDAEYLQYFEEQFGGLTPLGGKDGINKDVEMHLTDNNKLIHPWNITGSNNMLFKGYGDAFNQWSRTLPDGKVWNGQLHQIIDANGNVTNVGISAVADDVLKSMQAQYPGSKFDRIETSDFARSLSTILGIDSNLYAQLVTSTDTAIMTGKTEDIKSELANIKENVNSNTYTAKINGVDVEVNTDAAQIINNSVADTLVVLLNTNADFTDQIIKQSLPSTRGPGSDPRHFPKNESDLNEREKAIKDGKDKFFVYLEHSVDGNTEAINADAKQSFNINDILKAVYGDKSGPAVVQNAEDSQKTVAKALGTLFAEVAVDYSNKAGQNNTQAGAEEQLPNNGANVQGGTEEQKQNGQSSGSGSGGLLSEANSTGLSNSAMAVEIISNKDAIKSQIDTAEKGLKEVDGAIKSFGKEVTVIIKNPPVPLKEYVQTVKGVTIDQFTLGLYSFGKLSYTYSKAIKESYTKSESTSSKQKDEGFIKKLWNGFTGLFNKNSSKSNLTYNKSSLFDIKTPFGISSKIAQTPYDDYIWSNDDDDIEDEEEYESPDDEDEYESTDDEYGDIDDEDEEYIPSSSTTNDKDKNFAVDSSGNSEEFELSASYAPNIFKLAMLQDGSGHYYLSTKSMLENEATSILDLKPDANGVDESDWYLMVEPIFYLTLHNYGVNTIYKNETKFYGTLTNFYQWIMRDHPELAKNLKSTMNYKFYNASGSYASFYLERDLVFGEADPKTGNIENPVFTLLSPLTINETANLPDKYRTADGKFNGKNVLAEPTMTTSELFNLAYLGANDDITKIGKDSDDGCKLGVGFGLHVYSKTAFREMEMVKTHTWDKSNYGVKEVDLSGVYDDPEVVDILADLGPVNINDPGPAPSNDNLKNEDTWGDKSKNLTISKFYYILTDDMDLVSTQTRKNTAHTIEIENEGNTDSDMYWQVIGWSLGEDAKYPETGDLSKGYFEYVDENPPSNPSASVTSGDFATTIKLDPVENADDKVLYIMLLLVPVSKKKVDVVKVYETPNEAPLVDVELNQNVQGTYDGKPDLPDYKFVESKVTPNDRKDITDWNGSEGTPGTEQIITVPDDTKTIYIKYIYEQQPAIQSGLILAENEISHNFTLSEVNGILQIAARMYEKVNSPSCDYERWCSNHDKYHRCNATMTQIDPGFWKFSINNRASYDKKFVYKWAYIGPHDYAGTGKGQNKWTQLEVPNMEMTLSRIRQDVPTLYKEMNIASVVNTLRDMGVTKEDFNPAKTRKDNVTEQAVRKVWNDTFKTEYRFENETNPVIEFTHARHGKYKKLEQKSSGSLIALNAAYSQNGNTTIHGLWGKPNDGLTAPKDNESDYNRNFTVGGISVNATGTAIDSSQKIQFFPYYRMLVQTLSNRNNQSVYLTSENLSRILNVNRVDTGIGYGGTGNDGDDAHGLYLSSYQWSIHKRVQDYLNEEGIDDKDSVLPTGAIYQLTTGADASDKKSKDTWVGMRAFVTYVDRKDKLAAGTESGIKDKNEAVAALDKLEQDVKDSLTGYEIVMRGKTGIDSTSNSKDLYSKTVQITGAAVDNDNSAKKKVKSEFDLTTGGNSDSLSGLATEEKYDLKSKGNTDGNSSDLDILDEKKEEYDWYLKTIPPTTAENNNFKIEIYRDNMQLVSLDVSKNQGMNYISSLATAGNTGAKIAMEFDARTKLISNYINAFDKNLGADRQGAAWYTEGWDNLHCIEKRWAFRMGFGSDGTGIGEDDGSRSAALNIKLNGHLDDKNDLYNMEDEDKVRTFKFYTSERSTRDVGSNKPVGYLADFEGQVVKIPNIMYMFESKRFYTSNTTVNDLN